jgi:hypothetical protein
VLPGFDAVLDMSGWQLPWLHWLNDKGYDFADPQAALAVENERPAELSSSTFLTNGFLDWLADRREPWFAHLSYLRPHPPYSAAGEFSTMYDPSACPPPLPIPDRRHRFTTCCSAFPSLPLHATPRPSPLYRRSTSE